MTVKKFVAMLSGLILVAVVGFAAALYFIGHSSLGVTADDKRFMQMAYDEAKAGQTVGAVVVYNGEVIGRAHNKVIGTGESWAHAEILALNQAMIHLKVRSFEKYPVTLYSTLEPCPMCEGFIVWKEVSRVIFGKKKPVGLLFQENVWGNILYRLRARVCAIPR